MHPDERAARLQLAACYRVFALLGWTEMIYNHITLRLPDSVTGGEKHFLINPFGLDQLLQHAQLIVGVDDREIGLEADQFGVAAQHLGGNRVESAEPGHALDRRADQLADTLAHFARGAVGEGDAEDLAWPGQAAAHQMRQPAGERRRLAGTGTRQHQHRALGGQNCLALGRVQPVDERVGRGVGHGGLQIVHP